MIIFINYPKKFKGKYVDITLKERFVIGLILCVPYLILIAYAKYSSGDFNHNKQELQYYKELAEQAYKDGNLEETISYYDSVSKYKQKWDNDRKNRK